MFKITPLAVTVGILTLIAGCKGTGAVTAGGAASNNWAELRSERNSTSASELEQTQGGKEPAWVADPYAVYRKDLFIAASGFGADRHQAERNALAALVAVFGQSIQAELRTTINYSEAVSQGVVQVFSEDTSIQRAIKTSSEMDSLIGAEIRGLWVDPKNVYYAVAVLDKSRAAILYRDMITSNQRSIQALVAMSDTEKYTLDGYARYQLAATIADVNRVYANVLTMVGDTPGIVPGDLKNGDMYRLEALNITKSIPITVAVANDQSDRIKGAFASALTKQGFRSGGTNSRYVLNVRIVLSEVDRNLNPKVIFVRYEVDAQLSDGDTVLFPFNINGREGHLSLSEAENRAIAGAEKKINDTYGQKLSEYLSRLLPHTSNMNTH